MAEEHQLEAIEVGKILANLSASLLLGPSGLLELTEDISLSESLGQGTWTNGTWNVELDGSEGKVAEWDGLAGDTGEGGWTIDQSLIKRESIEIHHGDEFKVEEG